MSLMQPLWRWPQYRVVKYFLANSWFFGLTESFHVCAFELINWRFSKRASLELLLDSESRRMADCLFYEAPVIGIFTSRCLKRSTWAAINENVHQGYKSLAVCQRSLRACFTKFSTPANITNRASSTPIPSPLVCAVFETSDFSHVRSWCTT